MFTLCAIHVSRIHWITLNPQYLSLPSLLLLLGPQSHLTLPSNMVPSVPNLDIWAPTRLLWYKAVTTLTQCCSEKKVFYHRIWHPASELPETSSPGPFPALQRFLLKLGRAWYMKSLARYHHHIIPWLALWSCLFRVTDFERKVCLYVVSYS